MERVCGCAGGRTCAWLMLCCLIFSTKNVFKFCLFFYYSMSSIFWVLQQPCVTSIYTNKKSLIQTPLSPFLPDKIRFHPRHSRGDVDVAQRGCGAYFVLWWHHHHTYTHTPRTPIAMTRATPHWMRLSYIPSSSPTSPPSSSLSLPSSPPSHPHHHHHNAAAHRHP